MNQGDILQIGTVVYAPGGGGYFPVKIKRVSYRGDYVQSFTTEEGLTYHPDGVRFGFRHTGEQVYFAKPADDQERCNGETGWPQRIIQEMGQ